MKRFFCHTQSFAPIKARTIGIYSRIRAELWQQSKLSLFVIFCGGFASPASASFQVCNQTLDVVNVAVGFWDIDSWRSQGWWTIGPNQCANVIEDTLRSRFIYVYARDVFNRSILEGTTTLCIEPDAFNIPGRENCLANGNLIAPFVEVDTRASERWTFFLTAPDL